MQIYNSDTMLRVSRIINIQDRRILVGDQIPVGKYTATCQAATQEGALFLLDQYLDRVYPMEKATTNLRGYDGSSLREALQGEEILALFADYRDRMQPFSNGDLLRIPFMGELFDSAETECLDFESDDYKQWPLMKDQKNRIALRRDTLECGWLQNRKMHSTLEFCSNNLRGKISSWEGTLPLGVRPVFCLK